MNAILLTAAALILARWIAELWLDRLNRRHVLAHADRVPPAFEHTIDQPTYEKSFATLAKNSLSQVKGGITQRFFPALTSGVLPLALRETTAAFGHSAWARPAFFSQWDWPFVPRPAARVARAVPPRGTFWIQHDHAKTLVDRPRQGPAPCHAPRLSTRRPDFENSSIGPAMVVALGLGFSLLFQLLMVVLAPVVIMPLFNKFAPLPEGNLRQRLLAWAARRAFPARNIQVMDGSKRSRHSNAFFTGFGRFRKIVLFDTLIAQLSEPELEAVLAHEIGHYKKRHIVKMLAVGHRVARRFYRRCRS